MTRRPPWRASRRRRRPSVVDRLAVLERRPHGALPGQHASDLRHAAGQLERRDELVVRAELGERAEVAVARALEPGIGGAAVEPARQEAERDEHRRKRVRHHGVAPVVVARVDEHVPRVQVVVVQARRRRRRREPLAPRRELRLDPRNAAGDRDVARTVGARGDRLDRGDRLGEARRHRRGPHVRHAEREELAGVRRERALDPPVLDEGRGEAVDQRARSARSPSVGPPSGSSSQRAPDRPRSAPGHARGRRGRATPPARPRTASPRSQP